jgi:hypothetical protein
MAQPESKFSLYMRRFNHGKRPPILRAIDRLTDRELPEPRDESSNPGRSRRHRRRRCHRRHSVRDVQQSRPPKDRDRADSKDRTRTQSPSPFDSSDDDSSVISSTRETPILGEDSYGSSSYNLMSYDTSQPFTHHLSVLGNGLAEPRDDLEHEELLPKFDVRHRHTRSVTTASSINRRDYSPQVHDKSIAEDNLSLTRKESPYWQSANFSKRRVQFQEDDSPLSSPTSNVAQSLFWCSSIGSATASPTSGSTQSRPILHSELYAFQSSLDRAKGDIQSQKTVYPNTAEIARLHGVPYQHHNVISGYEPTTPVAATVPRSRFHRAVPILPVPPAASGTFVPPQDLMSTYPQKTTVQTFVESPESIAFTFGPENKRTEKSHISLQSLASVSNMASEHRTTPITSATPAPGLNEASSRPTLQLSQTSNMRDNTSKVSSDSDSLKLKSTDTISVAGNGDTPISSLGTAGTTLSAKPLSKNTQPKGTNDTTRPPLMDGPARANLMKTHVPDVVHETSDNPRKVRKPLSSGVRGAYPTPTVRIRHRDSQTTLKNHHDESESKLGSPDVGFMSSNEVQSSTVVWTDVVRHPNPFDDFQNPNISDLESTRNLADHGRWARNEVGDFTNEDSTVVSERTESELSTPIAKQSLIPPSPVLDKSIPGMWPGSYTHSAASSQVGIPEDTTVHPIKPEMTVASCSWLGRSDDIESAVNWKVQYPAVKPDGQEMQQPVTTSGGMFNDNDIWAQK